MHTEMYVIISLIVFVLVLSLVPKIRFWLFVARLPRQNENQFVCAFNAKYKRESLIAARNVFARFSLIPIEKLDLSLKMGAIMSSLGDFYGMAFSDFLEDVLGRQGYVIDEYDPSDLTVADVVIMLVENEEKLELF